MRVLLFILMIVSSSVTSAETTVDPLYLSVGAWSHHHIGGSNVTNESHDLVAVEYKSFVFGRFNNSYDHETWFALRVWRKNLGHIDPILENIDGSIAVGVNKGYRECYGPGDPGDGGKFCPDGYVGLSYTRYAVQPSIKYKPGVIIWNIETKFDLNKLNF